jgi:hypothetical protein
MGGGMSDVDIQPGTPVSVRCADGQWLDAVATSVREHTHRADRRIHDFPVVWVRFGRTEPVPWPAADVRIKEDA